MRQFALLAIRGYQRFISPYKGFHCAFHAHTGRHTCSGYGYRVIARYGVNRGYRLLQRRLHACSAVYQQHHQAPALLNKYSAGTGFALQRRRAQRGDCDVGGCDGCDIGSGDVLEGVCDVADCLDGNNKRKQSLRKTLFALLILTLIALIIWYVFFKD